MHRPSISSWLTFVDAVLAITARALAVHRAWLPIRQLAHAISITSLRVAANGCRVVVRRFLGNVRACAQRAGHIARFARRRAIIGATIAVDTIPVQTLAHHCARLPIVFFADPIAITRRSPSARQTGVAVFLTQWNHGTRAHRHRGDITSATGLVACAVAADAVDAIPTRAFIR